MNEKRDKCIEEVLTEFDFDKVHTAMVAVKWTWRTEDGSGNLAIPSRDALVMTARDLLEKAWRNEGTVRTGGFCAWYETATNDGHATLGLEFLFATADTEVWP